MLRAVRDCLKSPCHRSSDFHGWVCTDRVICDEDTNVSSVWLAIKRLKYIQYVTKTLREAVKNLVCFLFSLFPLRRFTYFNILCDHSQRVMGNPTFFTEAGSNGKSNNGDPRWQMPKRGISYFGKISTHFLLHFRDRKRMDISWNRRKQLIWEGLTMSGPVF